MSLAVLHTGPQNPSLVLSCPALQDPRPGEQSCTASGTAELVEPIARNTVLITKYIPNRPSPLEHQWEGDVLRYGQKIRILANPMAQVCC